MIHNPFWAESDEEFQDAWRHMEAIKEAGKAKSIGVSNYLRPHLEATLATAKSPPVVNQIEFQPYLQRANNFVPWMKQDGIEIEAFKGLCPLTKGKGGPLDCPLERMAEQHNISSSAILLRWHLQQNVIVITTTRKAERLEEYAKTSTFTLTSEEMEEITQLGLSHHFRTGYQKRFDSDDRT